ncbi:MAG: hypothetical protein ACRD3O_21970, partial [Terriglobia bacterium]
CFPPDTQQLAYANLDQLRDLPNYSQLRLALFNSRMNGFERLLKSVGSDPETDVDAVILGWRGSAMNASSFFGLAEGNFDPTAAQTAVVQQHLSTRQYAGFVLSGDHSGASGGMFFTYLSSTLVAFGRLSDVEALVDGYLGNRSALNSNSNFVNWEGELDGQAPQWGITTGAAAAKVAAPWLGAGKQSMSDLTALFKPIKAVLYQVDWSNSFTVHLSVVCDSAGDAQTLDRLLGIWQNSMAANNGASAGVNQFMQNVEISADGSRVELDGSGSPSLLGQLFRNGQPR